jgi:hypothetical protein
MTGCHSCKFKAAVDAGEFKDTPWEEVPCSSCDVMSGMGFAVEYDEERVPLEPDKGYGIKDKENFEEEDPVLPLSVMRSVVTGLLTLKSEHRDVVAWRYLGLTYPEIAERQGVTTACVEKRHRRALALWPALKEMFPEKVAKQKRRKKAALPRIGDNRSGTLYIKGGVESEPNASKMRKKGAK